MAVDTLRASTAPTNGWMLLCPPRVLTLNQSPHSGTWSEPGCAGMGEVIIPRLSGNAPLLCPLKRCVLPPSAFQLGGYWWILETLHSQDGHLSHPF